MIHEPKPIELERSAELTRRIVVRQLKVDPHCRICLKLLSASDAVLLDYDGKFPDVVCLACRAKALKGGGL